jgi:cytidyltransferase-like protein
MPPANIITNPRVGLVTGVFDILHQGHAQFLIQALNNCDRLYVGLETDARVLQMKGTKRPIYSQVLRQVRLSSLLEKLMQQRQQYKRNWRAVWQIELLPENFGDKEIRLPWVRARWVDILFVSENDPYLMVKKKLMQEIGGKIEIVKMIEDHLGVPLSMTKIWQGKQKPDYLVFREDEILVPQK